MIGEKLREVRGARHLSLSDVAVKAHISAATLSRIENGKQGIDLGLFLTLLKILRVQPVDVLEGENGETGSGDRLVDQITALEADQRTRLWRDLAASRRTQRVKPSSGRALDQKVEELAAQMEYMREEIEVIRARRRR
jgi:transcriptional regulator with XRE-family HTH domain